MSHLAKDGVEPVGVCEELMMTRTLVLFLVALSACSPEREASAEADRKKPRSLPILLKNPGLAGWEMEYPGTERGFRTKPASGFDQLALPNRYFVPIFDRVEKPRTTIGRTRRGAALSVRKADTTMTCYDLGVRGSWYEIEGGGVLCNTSGYDIVQSTQGLNPPQKDPELDKPIPFRYARIITSGTPRLSRRPTLDAWNALATIGGPKDDPSGLMIERMVGDFFVGLDEVEIIDGLSFMRTVRNEYILAKDLKVKEPPKMRGERLRDGQPSLPMAFIWGESVNALCPDGKKVCGIVEKHARFRPKAKRTVGGSPYYVGPSGILVPEGSVRLAETIKRPGGVGPNDRWIHINLSRQTLVAYEGEKPVYVTLVSSGKKGYGTPAGLYRMQRKYWSKTMRAVDPNEGLYHIEDIPFVMYYYGNYAIHGAFWHDVFGEVRSHGCTNLAPPDARWIYYWSDPEIREGWHGIEKIDRGLAMYFSYDPNESS